jgi:hypothetical protein
MDIFSPSVVTPHNLCRVSGALQDMKDRNIAMRNEQDLAVPQSPGIPPAAFGAGGKM